MGKWRIGKWGMGNGENGEWVISSDTAYLLQTMRASIIFIHLTKEPKKIALMKG